ncbi:metal ABC transporter substrate-binding protein [Halobaculum magnesiiphilum]|uniref:Metal ABC transporter substrate-binding protein n=1 Tax=Halobaculum magnesiiphilum TaxID=1017351 RepID=A0A8T8WAN6_9EURY|nr:zinc ABC transporter substrate-binding protein [Halobaculum magnesiiphilum]QZP36823.1 metal ABC transporter substrate-binding protein [Halobaculum magnesiiphilum]
MDITRRRLIASAAGTVGVGSVAGCLGGRAGGGTSDSGPTAQGSFFVFGDIAARVAGDATATDLLVPVGQHGHGWEPGPRVREEIRDADLLVHGMEGFQPWVDDVLADLDADGSGVETVDASADVDLIAAGEHHGDDHTEDGHDDHEESHTAESHHENDHTEESHDDHEEDHDGEEGGHDHGGTDPHFWMDPLRVRDAAETVREALSAVDPDAADAHADNAAAFREELETLDERIESLVADAARDTVLVAGHDSFAYAAERYGLSFRTLTGLAPDDQPTTRDIERAGDVIDEHGLRYVSADPLESQRAAEQLVAETDAEEVLPLTAMPGLTDEWAAEDWGYVEVMEEVNLPTLERVLTE